MVKIIGGKEFAAMSSTDAANNSIFLDSADNKLKKKDNSGNVATLGGGVFWINSDLHTVYDDFDSYTVGAFSSNSKWTVVAGTVEISNTQNAGGDTNELKLTNATVEAIDLTPNVDKHFKLFSNESAFVEDGHYSQVLVSFDGGSTETVIASVTKGVAGNSSTVAHSITTDLTIVAKGSDEYDAYIGGKLIETFTDATPTVRFRTAGGTSTTTYLYIDDVVESN